MSLGITPPRIIRVPHRVPLEIKNHSDDRPHVEIDEPTPPSPVPADEPTTADVVAEAAPAPVADAPDNAATAKAALVVIEEATAKIRAIEPMCREAWRDYGAALLAQRELLPSNNAFGAWVKEHGLDTGRAKTAEVRSDAMWLAKHWDELQACKTEDDKPIAGNHPVHIRTMCRKYDLPFAFKPVPYPKHWKETGATGADAATPRAPIPEPTAAEATTAVPDPTTEAASTPVASVPETRSEPALQPNTTETSTVQADAPPAPPPSPPWADRALQAAFVRNNPQPENPLFPLSPELQAYLAELKADGAVVATIRRLDKLLHGDLKDIVASTHKDKRPALKKNIAFVTKQLGELKKKLA